MISGMLCISTCMGALHAVALLNAEMQLNNHMNYINEENGTLIALW